MRGRPPNNYPQTMDQMLATNERMKPKRPSKRDLIEANKDTISSIVGDLADRLEEAERCSKKADMRDLPTIKDITLRYIRSCQISGTVPSMAGLSLAIGITPQSMSIYMKRHPDSETTKWLKTIKEHFGDLIGQSALNGSVAPVPAIFVLKSNYGWRDDPEPEVQNNDGSEELSPDAIAAKWSDLPD